MNKKDDNYMQINSSCVQCENTNTVITKVSHVIINYLEYNLPIMVEWLKSVKQVDAYFPIIFSMRHNLLNIGVLQIMQWSRINTFCVF